MKCLGVEEMDRLKMLKLERSEDGWVGIQCLWEFQPPQKSNYLSLLNPVFVFLFQVCPGLQKVTLLKRCVRCAIDVSRNSPGL